MSARVPTSARRRRLRITPPQIVGPFYPVGERPDTAGDLARALGAVRARGAILYVVGRVLNTSGEPVRDARIEIWQANADGKYCHPSDANTAPLDPHFRGFASLRSDANGAYRLRTIKPGRYPTLDGDLRPPHIHFSVDGRFDRLVTQPYFAGEPENQTDRWLNSSPRPEQLIVTLRRAPRGMESGAHIARFDIVLPTG